MDATGAPVIRARTVLKHENIRLMLLDELLCHLERPCILLLAPNVLHAPVDRRKRCFEERECQATAKRMDRKYVDFPISPAHRAVRLFFPVARAPMRSRSSRLRSAYGPFCFLSFLSSCTAPVITASSTSSQNCGKILAGRAPKMRLYARVSRPLGCALPSSTRETRLRPPPPTRQANSSCVKPHVRRWVRR